jgi:hypothetical protein
MSDHAEFPPSSLEHWNNCPGFIQAESEDDYFSEKGTRLHKAWETGDSTLTEDEAKAVSFVSQCENDLVGSIIREQKINCAGITWGTIDYVKLVHQKAYLIDAKFGRISVQPAQTNIQMWAYSLGVWTETTVDEINVIIAVPYRGEVTNATFKRKTHCDSFKAYISRIIERVEQFRRTGDVSMLSYHPKSCSFCARYNCPIKQKRLTEALGADPLTPFFNLPAELDPQQISQAKILVNQFKRWAAEVDKRAMELSDGGAAIPGFERKFMSGRKKDIPGVDINRVWQILNGVVSPVTYTYKDLMGAAGVLNIPACVALIREKSSSGQKQANEQKFLDALRDADIGQPTGGYYYLKPKPEIYDEGN